MTPDRSTAVHHLPGLSERAPRYLKRAESVPLMARQKGIGAVPFQCSFGSLTTPPFWSRKRGNVFLAALLMNAEITFQEFFGAIQEIAASTQLRCERTKGDHSMRHECNRWLSARPKSVNDYLHAHTAVAKLTRELVTACRTEPTLLNFPSGTLVGLRLIRTDAAQWFTAENLAVSIQVESLQHGVNLLTWWHRTQQITYASMCELVDQLPKTMYQPLPLTSSGTNSTSNEVGPSKR